MQNKEQISDYTKISTEKVRKISAEEIGKEIGQVHIEDPENPNKIKTINPNKIKEEIFGDVKSGESVRYFEEEVLQREKGISGTNEALKKRKGIVDFLKRILKPKISDDYWQKKEELRHRK